jgi:uncharacterized protein YndB with AHSA1/START domain
VSEVDGTLEQTGEGWQLRFTRQLNHPTEKVWRAISEPEHLTAWFPFDIEGSRQTGASLRFAFRHDEGPSLEGTMALYEPPSTLELSWAGETLRFELQPYGHGTRFTLLNIFDELGKASRDAAGWHVCLDALAYHLDEQPPPRTSSERWSEVHPIYVKRFGAAASTIGPPAP